MNASGTGATFREWSNFACLVSTAVVYPTILVIAWRSPSLASMIGLLIAGVVVQTVMLVVLHIVLALVTRSEPDDERITAIERRASRWSGGVLSVGVVSVVGLSIVQGIAAQGGSSTFASPLLTGYVLLACFVVAELTRMSITAVGYRTT